MGAQHLQGVIGAVPSVPFGVSTGLAHSGRDSAVREVGKGGGLTMVKRGMVLAKMHPGMSPHIVQIPLATARSDCDLIGR